MGRRRKGDVGFDKESREDVKSKSQLSVVGRGSTERTGISTYRVTAIPVTGIVMPAMNNSGERTRLNMTPRRVE